MTFMYNFNSLRAYISSCVRLQIIRILCEAYKWLLLPTTALLVKYRNFNTPNIVRLYFTCYDAMLPSLFAIYLYICMHACIHMYVHINH